LEADNYAHTCPSLQTEQAGACRACANVCAEPTSAFRLPLPLAFPLAPLTVVAVAVVVCDTNDCCFRWYDGAAVAACVVVIDGGNSRRQWHVGHAAVAVVAAGATALVAVVAAVPHHTTSCSGCKARAATLVDKMNQLHNTQVTSVHTQVTSARTWALTSPTVIGKHALPQGIAVAVKGSREVEHICFFFAPTFSLLAEIVGKWSTAPTHVPK
jgi:hypothetical protein